MLACICAGAESPLTLVEEIHVFGSFARGALEPHDVDVAVEFTPDEEFVHDMVRSMSQGRFPYAGLRTALTGRSRGLQFQFRELENLRSEKVETLLLWRMGEKIATATARLAAIKPDPAAGRAEHDAMLPAFEGIDRWVPRPVRELITPWVEAGAVTVAQVELPDAATTDAIAAHKVATRWNKTSPLTRAATNALAYLEHHDVQLQAVHLHGKDIAAADTPRFVGFQWRHAAKMHGYLTRWDGETRLEVPRPVHGSKPLVGVRTDVLDRTAHAGLPGELQ